MGLRQGTGLRPYKVRYGGHGVGEARDGRLPIGKFLGGKFQFPDGAVEAAVKDAGSPPSWRGLAG